MDGMEEKINAFLSNPDALEKVMGMARALGAGGASAPSAPTGETAGNTSDEAAAPAFGQLAPLLGGLQNMDPKMLSGLMSLVGTYTGQGDRRESLLLSLKPYLRSERQGKLDRAAQMMRIARTARVGLKTFLGGGENA